MSDTLITFVRHGKNHWGMDTTLWHAGPSLNPEGRKQAEKTGRYLKHLAFDAVISSDMNRAAETSKIICRHQKKVAPENISFARELAEHDEIVYGYTHKTNINPDGERAKARSTVKFFRAILKKYKGQRILISAHGNVIRACVGAALKLPPPSSPEINSFNCSLTTLAFRGSRLRTIFHINHTAHLGVFSFLRRLKSVKFISDYSKLINGESILKK